MMSLEPAYGEIRETLKAKAASSGNDEAVKTLLALERLLGELDENGLMGMIDLDPYFGETSLPLKEETDLLAEKYPEDFAFFKNLMDDLQEEIEIHFEVTDLYEDEEFEQFEEDVRIIKSHYTESFNTEYRAAMDAFAKKVLQELG
ncbi:hypothetical protein [Hydrogenimonas urashimensis]|uniref:hypothetical protein n=1 Tax=Hydrogenimonas urashimensis TaxID=2740515 RepID=UPI0019151183|nr:hypothetical protein [Hydrogenimonas urashimensis]